MQNGNMTPSQRQRADLQSHQKEAQRPEHSECDAVIDVGIIL